ncbi:MAG: amidohydrolase family protein [Gemmatimonadaceae bacterium]|nr:amidohydrolase family protein [Gemmatimonadaceae bacterium]
MPAPFLPAARRRNALAVLAFTALLTLLPRVFAAQAPDRWALVGGTVIPATGGAAVTDAVVLVEGRHIRAVGPRASTRLPVGTREVDARGRFILPGMIDANVHLVLMITPEFYVKYEERFSDIAVQGAQIALKFGLTTVMDSWGPLGPLLEARRRISNGSVEAARVLVAGNIAGLGGPFSPYFMGTYDLRGTDLRYGGWVHPIIQARINAMWEAGAGPELLGMTATEAGRAIATYLGQGPDFLKVAVSAHGIGPVEPLMFSSAALAAMRNATRQAGKHFQTHTFSLESLREAVAVHPQLLQHPNVMSVPPSTPAQLAMLDSLLAEIRRLGIYSAPLAVPHDAQQAVYESWTADDTRRDPHLGAVIQGRQRGSTREAFEARRVLLQRWIASGVKFVIGTDQGPEAAELGPVVWGRMGRRHFEVMEGLQQAGARPMDIIVAATRHGAEAYGLADSLGTIEVGKVADLLVVDDDPLRDVGNLRRIHQVIKGGRVVSRDALPTVKVLEFDPAARWPR